MYEIDQGKIHFDQLLYAKGCTKLYTYGEEDEHKVVKRKSCANKNVKEEFEKEFTFGGFRDDENIVSVEAYLTKATQIPKGGYNVYFLMPRMEGNLFELLTRYRKKRQHISLNRLVQYFFDLASGLRSLHLARIAHRNINLFNILFDKQNKLKLSDFSCAVSLDEINETKEKDHHCKQDIWNLGIVFLEICLLEKLELDPNELENIIQKNLLKVQKMYNEQISNLLKEMLSKDAAKRKTAKEIHEEIKKIMEELKGKESSSPTFFDQTDKENINENLIARQEEAQKQITSQKPTKFYSQKNLMKNEIFESKIEIDNKTTPITTTLGGGVLKEKRMKSNSPPPDQVKKTSTLRKFSLINYTTPEKSENLHTKKFSLNNYTNLSSGILNSLLPVRSYFPKEISEIQKQYRDCFEIELNRPSWQNLTLTIMNADDHSNLNDETMEVFAKTIASCFNSCGMGDFLSQLTFQLNHCLELTDHFLEVLGNSISHSFENISLLNLSFSKPLSESESSLQLTDEGLKKLAKKIGSHLRMLQSLTLEFSSCSQITKKGVMEFADLFKAYFKHLKELNLSFSLCHGVGDNAFCYLGNVIHENQRYLQKLTLRGYMTNETKKTLEHKFGKIIGFN